MIQGMVSQETESMRAADKRNLMAIDDLGDELGDIIDWAIAFKHGGELTRDLKPLDGM